MNETELHGAVDLLGSLLLERRQSADVVAIGGGVLLLSGLSTRATADLDVVARKRGDRWVPSRPLPTELTLAVEEVATALGLPQDKPWLNDGPSFLFELGLPAGWEARTTTLCRIKDGTSSFIEASGITAILGELGVRATRAELDGSDG